MKPNQPNQQDIAVCAYYIWEKEGCHHGRDVENWLQAETQLLAAWALEQTLQAKLSKNEELATRKQGKKNGKPIVPMESSPKDGEGRALAAAC